MTDEEVVSLASTMLARRHGSLVRTFAATASGNPHLEKAAATLAMSGSVSGHELQELGNHKLAEFLKIVASGVGNGTNARRAIALFRSRLEREIKLRDRFRAKVGASMALTYMGMGVFFPLFSGISSIVLTSSLGTTYGGAGQLGQGFLIVSITYASLILYITTAFAHPERRAAGNLISTVPYAALAMAVMLITRNYLAGML